MNAAVLCEIPQPAARQETADQLPRLPILAELQCWRLGSWAAVLDFDAADPVMLHFVNTGCSRLMLADAKARFRVVVRRASGEETGSWVLAVPAAGLGLT